MADTQAGLREGNQEDLEVIWRTFKEARLRKESVASHERLCIYLHEGLARQYQANTSATSVVLRRRNKFGLLPSCVAFSPADECWELSGRPRELVEALEEHVDLLMRQVGAEAVTSDLRGGRGSVAEQLFSRCVDFAKTAAKVAACPGNYLAMSQSQLTGKVMKMCYSFWKLSREKMSEVVIRNVLLTLIHSVACLHSMLDPHKTWKQYFTNEELEWEWDECADVVPVPAEVVPFFTSVFTQKDVPLHFDLCTELYSDLQIELLHMMGALLSSAETNATMAAVSIVCLPLLAMLDPREGCSPRQALVVSVVIKATHTLHCYIPEDQQVQVDVNVMLSGFLNILTPRYGEEGSTEPCYEMVITILDHIPLLVTPPTQAGRLRQMMLELGCFIKITELMNTIRETVSGDQAKQTVLCCSVLHSMTAIMQESVSLKEAYESTVSYTRLRQLLTLVAPPSTDILSAVINMVVEGVYDYQSHTHSIYNTWALAMLLRWLPSLPDSERAWLIERLYDIISFSAPNRQRCCGAGLIAVVVEVLAASQEEGGFSEEVEVLLVHILEVLGSHSIQTAELKQVIGALRPLPNGQLPTYYYNVQKALSVMSHDVIQEKTVPLYYFDLRPKKAIISIPGLTHFPSSSSSLSFHTWICLDYPLTTGRSTYSSLGRTMRAAPVAGSATLTRQRRRILFSFYSGAGSGFETFFTNSLVLVVAIATKKEFTTLALTECPLSPLVWHSVGVVYHGGRRLWQKGEMKVYIDGELKRTVTMRGPNLSETYKQCHIGSVPSPHSARDEDIANGGTPSLHSPQSQSVESGGPLLVGTVGVAEVEREWGREANLRGLISSLCLFSDSLSSSGIKTLHARGPNDLSLFQPKCHETSGMASKLFVYYHAKACRGETCLNLSPSSSSSSSAQLDGHFTGQNYVTRDVKAALSSLGGVGLLFPLLEQVAMPVMKRRGQEARDHTLSPTSPAAPILWFDRREGVASFFRLLVSMLNGSPTNQQVFIVTEGPAIIGALLQKVTPSLLTVQALSVIQELVVLHSNHYKWYWQLMTRLLFNFHIWCRPEFSVRIGHINFIMTVVNDNLKQCRAEFGVQYFLNVIRVFYCSMGSHVPALYDDAVTLSQDETMAMRRAILSILQVYLSEEVLREDLDAILSFLSAASDCTVQEELLKLLLSLVLSPDHAHGHTPGAAGLVHHLWTGGLPLLVLMRAESIPVRLATVKILSHLYMRHGGVSSSPLHSALSSGSLSAAVYQMGHHDLSSSVILALLELCMDKRQNLTEYISNFSVYFSVLQLLRSAPLMVRFTICQQLISTLHLVPTHINEIASFPDWGNLFLWLLTPFTPEGEERGGRGGVQLQTEDPPPYRKRLSAFLHSPTSPRPHPHHRQHQPNSAPTRGQRRSAGHASSWTQATFEDDKEDILQTFNIVTETIGYILWHAVNYERDRPPWKVWGTFLVSLDSFASQHNLILPVHLVKQRILTLLMNAVRLDAEGGREDHNSLRTVLLQLSLLFETFVLSHFPHYSPDNDEQDLDGELLNLSFTITMDINTTHCSADLFEQYLLMLTSAGVFESRFHSATDLELGQSVMRVLLGAISHTDKEYYVSAAVRLGQLVSQSNLPLSDSLFLLGHLTKILQSFREACTHNDHPEQVDYLVTVIHCIISCHGDALSLDSYLPGVPHPSSPSFPSSFLPFSLSQEWTDYYNEVLLTKMASYHEVLLPWLHTMTQRVRVCVAWCSEEDRLRKELIFQNEIAYEDDILSQFFSLRDKEVERQRSHDNQVRNGLLASLQRWRGIFRFFTGERGAWSSRLCESYVMKLNRTENFSRMRLKLSRDYSGNRHREASQLRDVGSIPVTLTEPSSADTALLSLVKVSARSPSLTEEDEALEQQLAANMGGAPVIMDSPHEEGSREVLVRREECCLVQFMERVAGHLEITTHNIFFHSTDRTESHSWITSDFKVRLDSVREIHSRRYNMQRTAIEIFLTDQTNYFLNFFSSKVVSKVYNSIIGLRTPNLTRVGIRKPSRLLQSSGLTLKWMKREISNFDYLMHLNTIAGRSYNDLNQYPVLPWVVVDFESEELDLESPATFRDFTKPVGSQNPEIERTVRERYEEFDDPTMGKFHFGSHYSNAAGVLHYLIRLEPFTSLHIDLQGGRFDHADRQFFSIASSWNTIYTTGTDVKELIPEFFYLPDFLKNTNDNDLGKLQSGERLGDVVLPNWAKTPEEFIRRHREALECEYVSSHLHHWIDLIFGYKQTGPEAEKATNLFNYYSYEDNVNLEIIDDERERRQIESIINNFGQTPTQLFTEPHPQRMTSSDARKTVGKGYGKRSSYNLFNHLDHIRTHCVDVSHEEDPVVFVGTPTIQTRALIASGNPEQLVTVSMSGRLNIHGWLPFSNSKTRPFTFLFDPNAHFDRSRCQNVSGPFSQDSSISPNLFVLSPNNKLLVTCGHWDNSFRVYSIEKAKLLARNEHHDDVVTCMALDRVGTGEHLITGSRDTTCVVWRFGSNEMYDHPLQTLYGHDSEVTCVDISTELDVAVSGAKDGTCIIHTVRRGHYMYTLMPHKERHKCIVRHVHISPLGRLLVYTEDKLARSKDAQCQLRPPCLYLYSVNGALIAEKDLSECLNDTVIVDKYIVTGNARGFLTFRDVFTLNQISSVNLLEAVNCISVVLDHQSKHASHLLVALEGGKLIIVSVGDPHSHTKS